MKIYENPINAAGDLVLYYFLQAFHLAAGYILGLSNSGSIFCTTKIDGPEIFHLRSSIV
jgi:hypothetical protein